MKATASPIDVHSVIRVACAVNPALATNGRMQALQAYSRI